MVKDRTNRLGQVIQQPIYNNGHYYKNNTDMNMRHSSVSELEPRGERDERLCFWTRATPWQKKQSISCKHHSYDTWLHLLRSTVSTDLDTQSVHS